MTRCPHGDPTCPCQDGDSCHYEKSGETEAWPCPLLVLAEDRDGQLWSFWPDGGSTHAGAPHCHVEGCDWGVFDTCGLLRIAPETNLKAALEIGCGAVRQAGNIPIYYIDEETT